MDMTTKRPAHAPKSALRPGTAARRLVALIAVLVVSLALVACGGNRTRAAVRLGISRRQLFDKIREYDLRP